MTSECPKEMLTSVGFLKSDILKKIHNTNPSRRELWIQQLLRFVNREFQKSGALESKSRRRNEQVTDRVETHIRRLSDKKRRVK